MPALKTESEPICGPSARLGSAHSQLRVLTKPCFDAESARRFLRLGGVRVAGPSLAATPRPTLRPASLCAANAVATVTGRAASDPRRANRARRGGGGVAGAPQTSLVSLHNRPFGIFSLKKTKAAR